MMDHETTIEALKRMWQRVLQRSSIDIEDNFFDLGGNPSLAAELFREISRTWNRNLPLVLIYQAPTIRTQAALLMSTEDLRCPPLLLLKMGPASPPVFFAHGMGADVNQLFALTQNLQLANPVYGMQARGFDGLDAPFDRIEDMAEFHLRAIRNVQPSGPYFLIGYSLGGLVTLEIADRLRAAGQSIALLAMLETYLHRNQLSLQQRTRLLARSTFRRLSALRQRPRTSGVDAVPPSAQTSAQVVDDGLKREIYAAEWSAWKHYRPRFYDGKIVFFKAQTLSSFPKDPRSVWAPLSREFVMQTVPGNHTGILTEHFGELAAGLSKCLAEAGASVQSRQR